MSYESQGSYSYWKENINMNYNHISNASPFFYSQPPEFNEKLTKSDGKILKEVIKSINLIKNIELIEFNFWKKFTIFLI